MATSKFKYYLQPRQGQKDYNRQWIKEGGKLVKTFPSGLVQITQNFVAPKDIYENFPEQFNPGDPYADSFPCIDNAFVFPKPDIQFIDGNFVRVTVTAYGRSNTDGTTTISKEHRANAPKLFYRSEPIKNDEGKIIRFETQFSRLGGSGRSLIVDFITKKFVVSKNDNLQLDLTVPLTTGAVRNGILLTTYSLAGVQLNNIPWIIDSAGVGPAAAGYNFVQRGGDEIISEYYPSQLDVVNFGEWNEVTVVIRDNIILSNFKSVNENTQALNKQLRP